MASKFRVGDRVKFQSTSTRWLYGTVEAIDGTIGVRFDGARDLTYIQDKYLDKE